MAILTEKWKQSRLWLSQLFQLCWLFLKCGCVGWYDGVVFKVQPARHFNINRGMHNFFGRAYVNLLGSVLLPKKWWWWCCRCSTFSTASASKSGSTSFFVLTHNRNNNNNKNRRLMCESRKHKLAQQQQHRRQRRQQPSFLLQQCDFYWDLDIPHTHTYPPPHTHTLIYLHWFRVFGFYCFWLGFYCYYLTSTLPTTSFGFQRRLGIKSKVQMLCGQFGFEVGQQRDAQLLRKVQKADPLANTFVCPYVLRFSLSFSLLSAVVTLRPFACHSPAHKESLSERGCVYPGNTMAERKSNYQWTKPNWVSSRSPKRDF